MTRQEQTASRFFGQKLKNRSAESVLLTCAGGLAILLTLILANSFVAFKVPVWAWLLLLGATAWFLKDWLFTKDQFEEDLKSSRWVWFLLPLVIALAVRLPWFGYREIQGDEGVVLVRAADVLLGDTVELLLHRKGPMEILLSMAVWDLLGEINDLLVRIPFLLANLVSLALLYALSERWFGRKVAVLATSLLAIVGFHVAFSRVVQYQSLVMMWGIGSALAAERYRVYGRLTDIILAAICLGAGLLSHYDAILYAPAVLVLLSCRWFSKKRIEWNPLLWGMGIGAAMLALFYIPFVLGPDFQNTLGYLLDERVGTESGGSIADVWQMATFYNSSWFIVGIAGFGTAGLIALLKRQQDWMVRLAAVLFFFAPFLFYIGIVSVPRTHIYTFFPGLAVLAGLGLVWIGDLRRERSMLLYRLGQVGFVAWYLLCASYIWLLFTWGPGEVQRHWDIHRPNPVLYWTTWDEHPKFGLFGFPYQAGWRQLGQTDMTGLVYASNEEEEITNWYMGQADRTHCDSADLFLLAENVQDEIVFNPSILENKTSAAVGPNMVAFVNERVDLVFGARRFRPEDIRKPIEFDQITGLDTPLGDRVSLLGYELIDRGELVEVVLYWQVHSYINQNFQAFVHAIDSNGELATQFDSAPECAINPTTRWEPGTVVRDPHPMLLPSDERVTLVAGMYDLISLDRLPVANEPGNFVFLTEFEK